MLTKSSKYSIQALILIAAFNQNECMLAKQIAAALSIPKDYLNKVLRILVNEKFLKSCKGPQGGFSLARPANDITIYDVMQALEGTAFFTDCLIRPIVCHDNNPCALHNDWFKILGQIRSLLDSVTIADLVKEVKSGSQVLNFDTEFFLLEKFKKQIGIN